MIAKPLASGMRKVESMPRLVKVWNELESTIASDSRRETRNLGYRNGSRSHSLHVRDDLGIWMAPHRNISNYRWAPFGTLPMKPSGNLSMIVQINRVGPRSNRATAGLLAVDPAGDEWICHTGGVGGGTEGVGKTAFLSWSGVQTVPVLDSRGRITDAIPVARVGDANLPGDIATFVKLVARYKAKEPRPARSIITRPLPPKAARFIRELESATIVEGRSGYVMTRHHSTVCNHLKEAISAVRKDAFNDKARDLYVGKPQAPDFQFEIKPSADTQSIYTALGQLFLHSTGAPARRSVIVLPNTLKPALRSSIEKLGIDVVTFTLTKNRIHFHGLDTLLPGTPTMLPLTHTR